MIPRFEILHSVRIIAQSGARRIPLSVKILAGAAVAGIDDPGFSKVITWDICRDHRSRLQQKNHIQFHRGIRLTRK
jgi:hypothetical protein